MKSINMKEYFHSNSLSYRDSAKKLMITLRKKYSKEKIIINFAKIESISHSFADEILKRKSNMKNVQLANLNPNIKKMFNVIEKKYAS